MATLPPVATPPRVAVACQGGGSHAAFTAGVLLELLRPEQRGRYDLVGLSGTSGGAVCAGLVWAGLLAGGPEEASRRLAGFWADLAAEDGIEAWLNLWTQWLLRLPVTAEASPYAYSPLAEPTLRRLLAKHLRPETLPADPVLRARPALRIGAARVLGPDEDALDGERFTVDDIVASAAVPPLFRAVTTRGELYWDGLYSQNPPLRDLLRLDPKPQEIWVIRLNPTRLDEEPRTIPAITDRRNEKAGNLPLEQELFFIRKINQLRVMSAAVRKQYDAITVRLVELDLPDLDYQSKLDRSAALLNRLLARGRERARDFFEPGSILVPPEG